MNNAITLKFHHPSPTFTKTIREKMKRVMSGTPHSSNATFYGKAVFLIKAWVIVYLCIYSIRMPYFVLFGLLALLGFLTAGLGFNVMHDGAHGSASKYPWVNTMLGSVLNVLGGILDFWKLKHNVMHHSYTNINDHDEDIKIGKMARLHPSQPRYWFHRFQFLYLPGILYGLSYLAWVWFQDFQKYFKGAIGNVKINFSFSQHVVFWLSKILHVVIFIIIPWTRYSFLEVIVGYVFMMFITGLVISFVFQLAHVVEGPVMVVAPKDNIVHKENKVHQVLTTANFATKNKFLTWYLGGLNFQIEHHLFPEVSHVHYPKIQPGVKEACKEFGLTYNEHPTFFGAVWSHLKELYRRGQKEYGYVM